MSLLHTWVRDNPSLITPAVFERWENMQSRHLPDRDTQFDILKKVVATTSWRLDREDLHILDLGCGPGGLLARVLRFGKMVRGIGLNADPFLLALSKAAHPDIADRAVWLEGDYRTIRFAMREPLHAIISSTALHWLGTQSLVSVYERCAEALEPGGVLVIADPLAGESSWRQGMIRYDDEGLKAQTVDRGETWTEFYDHLAAEWPGFGEAMADFKERQGLWEGNDDGYPWSFHEDAFARAGLAEPEIHFRHGRGAVFGAVKP